MSGRRRFVAVLGVFLLALPLFGCNIWNMTLTPRGVPWQVRVLGGGGTVPVGAIVKLNAQVEYAEGDPTPGQVQGEAAASKWTVEPSDGAVVSPGGNFKASKPGVYTVTVTFEDRLSDSTQITVKNPESAFEGTYQGTIAASSNLADAQVPWEFTVGADGKLKGGYRYALTSQVKMAVTFTGVVAEDGGVAARGTGTGSGVANGKRTSVSSAISLTGKISGTTFSGSFAGGKGSKGLTVTAERQ